jgi:molybdate transport system ATP-binding protein
MNITSGIHAHLNQSYAGFQLDVDVAFPAKGVTAIYGPSGSGKSTLLRCIAGLEHAEGSLIVNGDVWQDKTRFIAPHQRPIGYVFQEATLFPHMTILDNLNYGFKRQSQNHNGFSLEPIIQLLGIEHLLNRKPEKLSGGEKQRVAIARALAVNPKILLMDEPMSALDLARKREILPFLEKLHNELSMPVLYVTHSPNEVARLADHLVVLDQGKVVANGGINDTISQINTPVQLSEKASVIIETTITAIDKQWHLAQASFDGGSIWVRDLSFSIGDKLRFRIMARDVSIALSHDHETSISNILPAVVDQISLGDHPSISLIRLKIGGNFILCRLTNRSLDRLGIKIGQKIMSQIKLAAIIE